MLEHPDCIQRCNIQGGELKYDYMGSSEFEVGEQAKSLKRIFALGITLGSAKIRIEGKEIEVFMVAGKGFPFADYQRWLQQLAENKLRLQEQTYFDYAVLRHAGLDEKLPWYAKEIGKDISSWFDFPNDVLWTLTEEGRQGLVRALEITQGKWAARVLHIPE